MGLQFPYVQYGEIPNFFDFGSKPVRATTPLKVHNFKKIQGAKNKNKSFWKNVFFNAYFMFEDNQILHKTFF